MDRSSSAQAEMPTRDTRTQDKTWVTVVLPLVLEGGRGGEWNRPLGCLVPVPVQIAVDASHPASRRPSCWDTPCEVLWVG